MVLAVGSLATAALAAVQGGLPALSPAIQETYNLSLVEVMAVFTAFALGTVLTLLAWGVLADRTGERIVISGGLAAGALAMFAAASSHGYMALLVWMVLAARHLCRPARLWPRSPCRRLRPLPVSMRRCTRLQA